jgi:hypothetical protein
MSSSFILMLFNKILPLASATLIPLAACASSSISDIKNPPPLKVEPVVGLVDAKKVVEIKVENKTWKCPGCNTNEKYVLEQLQKKTKISDRNALATIMGNIKSESNFHPNICEGGARVPYNRCLRGGYGLVQWTTTNRYLGLGRFAKKYGYDPSSLEGQTAYMINEYTFQRYLPEFEGPGQTVSQYMVGAYYWLGWGIKGNRETYAYNYTKKLVWS